MEARTSKEKFSSLVVGALGIVFGDIGTSPLYALKSCLTISGIPVTPVNILGIVSFFIWALILIVWFKYALLVMRVDNNGEGGILALTTLGQKLKLFRNKNILIAASVLGTALFLGDGIITPAISVLSAIEGLEYVTKAFDPYTVPLSIGILTILFAIQRKGSGLIGQYFGAVMTIWFGFLAIIGMYHIGCYPSILYALNPLSALDFLLHNKILGLATLGGVVLVVTGGEALYADMGHFGRQSIRVAWGFIVFPALVLNYLGQGANLLVNPTALENPFFALVPQPILIPAVILATMASVIAAQAIISGIFSITSQAILFNYFPRMRVIHTSAKQIGQIYIGSINFVLWILVVFAVLMFGSSDTLAHAYGLSVSGVMLLTSVLIAFVAYKQWGWNLFKVCAVFAPMICLDSVFLAANLVKIVEGAWYIIVITFIVSYTMRVWMKGNKALESQKFSPSMGLTDYLERYERRFQERIPGTAIFLSRFPNKVPHSLMIHLHHNKFLYSKTILLTFTIKDVPYLTAKERFEYKKLNEQSICVEAKFGFKESPNLTRVTHFLQDKGMIQNCDEVSVFLSKGVPVASKSSVLKGFSEQLYIFLASIAQNASDFYKIPNHKVIELGVRYKI